MSSDAHWLSVAATAQRIGLSESQLRALIHVGKAPIPCHRFGKQPRFWHTDVSDFETAGTRSELVWRDVMRGAMRDALLDVMHDSLILPEMRFARSKTA